MTTDPAPALDVAELRRVAEALEDVRYCAMEDDTGDDDLAGEASAAILALLDELERARAALKWYRDEAEAAAKYMQSTNSADALTAILTVLANDGGRRAREALPKEPRHDD